MMGFKIYKGVVESRADPLEIGRCKVRVIGVHDPDTGILPTKDLPWSVPMQPMTSAAVSGIGLSPTGPIEGTWCYLFFSDGENQQQPVMMGTIGGIPESVEQDLGEPNKSVSGTNYDSLSDKTVGGKTTGSQDQSKDSSSTGNAGSSGNGGNGNSDGNSGNNSAKSGEQVLTQETAKESAKKTTADGDYKLGQVSRQYESGNNGAGTVSSGKGDRGGVSYGTHQLASYRDNMGNAKESAATNSPIQAYVKQSKYSAEFKGLVPGTADFTNKWKEVNSKNGAAFESEQYEYFKGQYYNKGSNNLKSAGIDVSSRGNAVQEMLWSTSIQYGPGGARKVFVRALDGKDINSMSDAEIIEAVQTDKYKNVNRDFESSKDKDSLRRRVNSEKKDLLKLAGSDGNEKKVDKKSEEKTESVENTTTETTTKSESYTEESTFKAPPNATPESGVRVPSTPETNSSDTGFKDPNNRYPKASWLNESDVSRLARNKKTAQSIVKSKRNSLVTGVQTSASSWSEPASPYAAIYPLNHVQQTESGHVIELDDTPNAERVHVYHRAGSFIEFHPNGTVVYKSTKDDYDITIADKNVYVGGNCNITVSGNTNIYTKGVMNMESDGDMFIKTKSNLTIGAEGVAKIESNGEMFLGSSANNNLAGALVLLNCGYRAGNVNAGGYNAGDIAVEVMYDSAPPIDKNQEEIIIKELEKTGVISKDTPTQGTSGTPTESTPIDDKGQAGEVEAPKKEEVKPKCEGCCDSYTEADIKPSMKLSANFTLADLTTSCHYPHALREQGGNSKLQLVKNLCAVANNILEPIVAKYGRSSFIITSAFRAGSGSSQHLKGEAVDIQFVGMTNAGAAPRAKELSGVVGGYGQMILEWHGNAPVFHVSTGGKNQNLTTPNLKNYFNGFRNKDMSTI